MESIYENFTIFNERKYNGLLIKIYLKVKEEFDGRWEWALWSPKIKVYS